mmetsp:Transcript_81770/g.240045  ORF Transcript_81770/g.240045 Transcript_81770/m.240045 type:complete len:449 (+) Transcript_81770:197-1543(+)
MVVSALGLIRALFTNNAGLMADGYDLVVVDLILATLSELHPDSVTSEKKGLMACLMYAGMLTGMIVFGLFADLLSHKVAALLTSAFAILGCALSACCVDAESFSLVHQLAVCRFLLGFGIGGEYPVSMTLGSGKKTGNLFHEAGFPLTPEQILGANIVLLNVGSSLAPALGSVLLETGLPLHVVWRVLSLCGMFPSVCAFAARTHMPSQSAEHSTEDLESQDASVSWAGILGMVRSIGWRWPVLLGCCLAWGLQNFAFFGQASFRSVMEESMFGAPHTSRVQLAHDAHFGLFMSLFALLGSCAAVIVGEKVSLFWSQLSGFTGFTLFVGLCSLLLGPVHAANWQVFLLFSSQTFFLTAAGTICYIIPTQNFPARVHATCCGIAAAAGKMGALLGTAVFPIVEDAYGISILMLMCCCFGFAGLIVTAILTPRHPPDSAELMECKSLAHT